MKENLEPIMTAVVLTTRLLKEANKQLGDAERIAEAEKNEYRSSAIYIDILCCQESLSQVVELVDSTLVQIQNEHPVRTVEEFLNELQDAKAKPNPLVEPFMVYKLAEQYNKLMDNFIEELKKTLNS